MAVQKSLETAILQGFPSAKFEIQLEGGHYSGAVIADEFEKLTPLERQQAIWEKIRESLGAEATQVGILLLYTPEEAEIVDLAE